MNASGMRVTTLTHAAIPSHFTNTEQTICTFTELARLGIEVEIICRGERARAGTLRAEVSDYYGIASMPETIFFTPNGLDGAGGPIREGLTDLRNVLRAQRDGAGLVHTRDLFALALALVLGLRSVFETYRVDINRDRQYTLWRSWCYRQRHLLGIVTHSELSRRGFIDAGATASRVTTIYNGYEPAHFEMALSREAARAKLGFDPKMALVVYTGHVDPTKGMELLGRIALQIPEASFLLVGSLPGSQTEANVIRILENLGADNVRLLPRVPQAMIPTYLFAADCLIIPPTAAPLRVHGRTVLPMKTFSYLAAGRPIVAPDLPDLREVLRHNENALLVPPDDVDAAAAAIRLAVFDRALGQQLGNVARRDAAQYTWQARAKRFFTFLQNVCAPADADLSS